MPHSHKIEGRRWKAVFNGRNSLNGNMYGVTFTGRVESADDDKSIYDLLIELAEEMESKNRAMLFPDSFQITVSGPQ